MSNGNIRSPHYSCFIFNSFKELQGCYCTCAARKFVFKEQSCSMLHPTGCSRKLPAAVSCSFLAAWATGKISSCSLTTSSVPHMPGSACFAAAGGCSPAALWTNLLSLSLFLKFIIFVVCIFWVVCLSSVSDYADCKKLYLSSKLSFRTSFLAYATLKHIL